MTGTIKKKTDRGFGFIAREGQDNDLFFHSSALSGVTFDQLQEGQKVTFEVEKGNDGREKAVNVMPAGEGASAESAPTEAVEEPAAEPVEEPAAVYELSFFFS
jgi:CspA family cold shock protein